MASQQKIPLNALILWGILLLLFVILNQSAQPKTFPVPANLQQIGIKYAGKTMILSKNPANQQWQIAGKNTLPGRVEQVLNKLRSCHTPYPNTAITAGANPRPVIVQLNGDSYTLGVYNHYRHSHYLNDGRQSWLCDESLKAMLAQPAYSWLPENTR